MSSGLDHLANTRFYSTYILYIMAVSPRIRYGSLATLPSKLCLHETSPILIMAYIYGLLLLGLFTSSASSFSTFGYTSRSSCSGTSPGAYDPISNHLCYNIHDTYHIKTTGMNTAAGDLLVMYTGKDCKGNTLGVINNQCTDSTVYNSIQAFYGGH